MLLTLNIKFLNKKSNYSKNLYFTIFLLCLIRLIHVKRIYTKYIFFKILFIALKIELYNSMLFCE